MRCSSSRTAGATPRAAPGSPGCTGPFPPAPPRPLTPLALFSSLARAWTATHPERIRPFPENPPFRKARGCFPSEEGKAERTSARPMWVGASAPLPSGRCGSHTQPGACSEANPRSSCAPKNVQPGSVKPQKAKIAVPLPRRPSLPAAEPRWRCHPPRSWGTVPVILNLS